MKKAQARFAHWWVVFLTIMFLDLSVSNLVPRRVEYIASYLVVLFVFGTIAFAGWLMHDRTICPRCMRTTYSLRRERAVELWHRNRLRYFVAGCIAVWIMPQFWIPPQQVAFVIGQIIAIPLIAGFGIVWHAHMSWCTRHLIMQ